MNVKGQKASVKLDKREKNVYTWQIFKTHHMSTLNEGMHDNFQVLFSIVLVESSLAEITRTFRVFCDCLLFYEKV